MKKKENPYTDEVPESIPLDGTSQQIIQDQQQSINDDGNTLTMIKRDTIDGKAVYTTRSGRQVRSVTQGK